MSDGHIFRAIVRGLMKEEYLFSAEFAVYLRPGYEGPAGEEAVRSIAGVYDALPQLAAFARRAFAPQVYTRRNRRDCQVLFDGGGGA